MRNTIQHIITYITSTVLLTHLEPQLSFLFFSVRWTSQASTWASRSIILTSTTRSIATCWTLKFNTFPILSLCWVSIHLFWYKPPSPPPSPASSLSSLPINCMFIPCGEKAHQQAFTTFTAKGQKKQPLLIIVFVYILFSFSSCTQN